MARASLSKLLVTCAVARTLHAFTLVPTDLVGSTYLVCGVPLDADKSIER
jgi:hypothetical protein